METSSGEPANAVRSANRPVRAIAACLLPPLIGVLLAYWLLVAVLIPRMGVGDVQRIIDLGRALERELEEPTAVVIGNSVVIEGIHAVAVARAAPEGWNARNFAINGCDVTEQQIILPKLIEAGPEAVVFVLRAIDVGRVSDVNIAKLHAYSLSDFPAAFPDSYTPERLPGLSDESWNALHSSDRQSLLFFRRAPLTTAEAMGFRLLRQGRANLDTNNWDEPAELTASISGSRLERHFRVVVEDGLERTPEGETTGAQHIEAAVAYLAGKGIRPVLVIAPMHPQIPEPHERSLAVLRSLLTELEDRYGAVTGDASDLLTSDDFADAIHPNASGRDRLSAFVGGLLPATADTAPAESGR